MLSRSGLQCVLFLASKMPKEKQAKFAKALEDYYRQYCEAYDSKDVVLDDRNVQIVFNELD